MKRENQRKPRRLSAFGLILLAVLLGLWGFGLLRDFQRLKDAPTPVTTQNARSINPTRLEQAIERHKKLTQIQAEITTGIVALENQAALASIKNNSDNDLDLTNMKTPATIDIRPEERHKTALQDIARAQRNGQVFLEPPTPEERIQSQLKRDRWAESYSKKYQEAFVQEFLDNARSDGLEVELDEDLYVVGVRPVRQKTPLRFPQSTEAPTALPGEGASQ